MKAICIDAGNTLIKVALMEGSVIQSFASFPVISTTIGALGGICPLDIAALSCNVAAQQSDINSYLSSLPQADACIISSVGTVGQNITDILSQKTSLFMELTDTTPVPINNLYRTPETLGKDRLAAVVGAHSLFPGRDVLVFDAGTALTIDFIDSGGNYRGGNISPGLNMRFRALHDDTQKLIFQKQTDDYQILGSDTASAITSGVQNGIIFEIDYYIDHFVKQFPSLVTILTGGDMKFLVNKIGKYIFAEPNLVFIGLMKIIEFNTNM